MVPYASPVKVGSDAQNRRPIELPGGGFVMPGAGATSPCAGTRCAGLSLARDSGDPAAAARSTPPLRECPRCARRGRWPPAPGRRRATCGQQTAMRGSRDRRAPGGIVRWSPCLSYPLAGLAPRRCRFVYRKHIPNPHCRSCAGSGASRSACASGTRERWRNTPPRSSASRNSSSSRIASRHWLG